MKHPLISIITLCALFCNFCYTEDILQTSIDVKWRVIRTPDIYWTFEGTTNLPDSTTLAVQLFFEDSPISGSISWIWVKNKKFSYRYGPITKKILSGNYALTISYARNIQSVRLQQFLRMVPDTNYKHTLSTGNIHQQRQEIWEDRQEIVSWVKEMSIFLDSVTKKVALKKTSDLANWQESHLERINSLEKRIVAKQKARFGSHFVTIEKDFLRIMTLSKNIIHNQSGCLAHANSLEWSVVYTPEKQNYTDKFIEEIQKTIQEMCKRAVLPGSVDESQLLEDLKWAQQIAQNLQQHYISAKQNGNGFYDDMELEIQDFAREIRVYEDSPANRKHTTLLGNLRQLRSGLKQILTACKDKNAPEIKKSQEKFQQNWQALRNAIQPPKEEPQGKLSKTLSEISHLHQQLPTFSPDIWQQNLSRMQQQIAVFQNDSETYRNLRGALYWLQTIYVYQKKASPEQKKIFDLKFQAIMYRLQHNQKND